MLLGITGEMMMRSVIGAIAVTVLTIALGGWGGAVSYRYKLSIALNTPAGVKTASSVVEVSFWPSSTPLSGVTHKLNGEALYLDLGGSAKPLIALLTSQLHRRYGNDLRWSRDAGPNLSRLYPPPLPKVQDEVTRLSQLRGPHKITPDDLPDLVTFANTSDPSTVMEVNPNNLEAALGEGISWNEISLEVTDEPITLGIQQKLSWLHDYSEKNLNLAGTKMSTKRNVTQMLRSWDFKDSPN